MTSRVLPADRARDRQPRRVVVHDPVLRGHITHPLAKPIQQVVVIRRVSCGGARVVKRFKPRRNGTFRVTLLRTFTLPKYVDIG